MASEDFKEHPLTVSGVPSGRTETTAQPDFNASTRGSSWGSSTGAHTSDWLTSLPEPTALTSDMSMPEGDGCSSGALRVSSFTSYDSAEGAKSDLFPGVRENRDGWEGNFITTIPHHIIWTISDAQYFLLCNLDMSRALEGDEISQVPFVPTQWKIRATANPAGFSTEGTPHERVFERDWILSLGGKGNEGEQALELEVARITVDPDDGQKTAPIVVTVTVIDEAFAFGDRL